MDLPAIQKRIDSIEKLKDELKVAKEAIKNALDNDGAFVAAVAEAKEANSKKKRLKDEILNQAESQEFVGKIKDLREEISTLEELLAYELVEYSSSNNTDMIQGTDGFVRKFKIIVRLLPGRGLDSEQST